MNTITTITTWIAAAFPRWMRVLPILVIIGWGWPVLSTQAASAPTVITGAASSVTFTTATLGGTVTSNGKSTTVTFQYGTSTSYADPSSPVTALQSPLVAIALGSTVSAAITGLTCGTTYHFRVVGVNGSGTTNGSDATFTTTACAVPTATTGTASSLTFTGATLGGTVSSNGTSTTPSFDYGTSTSYGTTVTATPSPLATNASNSSVSAVLTGLTCGTTYHFRVSGDNSTGTTNGGDATFTTTACAVPTATTGTASSLTFTGATLGGTVSSNGTSTTVTFNYGTTTAYGSSATAAESPLGTTASGSSVSAAITGLSCGTLYHFRVVGVNTSGTTNGSDATFTTTACAVPTATTGTASSLTFTGATLGGTVSSNGTSTTVTFNYGTTTAYGSSATATQSPLASTASGSSVSAALTGLTCGTTYHFQIVGVNSSGTTNGSDATFTTTACAAPTATTGAASSLTSTGATLAGTVSSNGTSTTVTFNYGTTTGYGSTVTAAESPLATSASGSSVSAVLTGLTCGTLYHFRVVAVNGTGTTNGSDATFTTSSTTCSAPTATTGTASSITSTGATLGGTVSSNGKSTTVTFNYGTTTGYGSSVTAAQSPLATSASGSSVSAAITGLTCGTTYHFRVVGVNGSGTTKGSDATFSTPLCIAQSITFGSAPTLAVGGSGTVSATGGGSGNAVVFTIDAASTSGCSISGTTVTAGGTVGTCIIDANQASNTSYAAAPQVQQSVTVTKGSQTINFSSIPALYVGTQVTLSATSTSGLSVTFTVDPVNTTSQCSISGTTLTVGGTRGSCTVLANQSGNSNYNAAPQVSLTAYIGPGTQTITFGTTPTVVVGGTGLISVTTNSGLIATISIHNGSSAYCSVVDHGDNTATVSGLAAGTGVCPVDAVQGGNVNWVALYTSQTLDIGKGSQTIAFGTAPSLIVGGTGTVSATGGASTSTVMFSSQTTGTCTVSGATGSTVTGVAAGTCTIAANQAGDANYNAASPVTQSINVLNTPTVATGTASGITFTGATLNGTVSSNGASSTVTFQYGTTTGYGSTVTAAQSPLVSTASGSSVSAAITGLSCSTTYHFRVVGVNSVGTSNSGDATFTTSTCAVPTVSTATVTPITFTAATLKGSATSNGTSTTVTFQYGTTTGYGSTVTAAESPLANTASGSSVSGAITGLACSTTYHFRVVGTNSTGTSNSGDATFTTTTCAAPTVTTGAASSVTFTSAAVAGTVSSNGTSTTVTFQYGTSTSYGSSVTAAESPLASSAVGSSVSGALTGLNCGTLYHFRVVGVNGTGTTNGSDATFTTTACALPTATTGTASPITFTGATLNGTVSSNGKSTTVTFQYGTTTGYGSTVTATGSPLATTATGSSVSAAITGLTCGTTYHFRVVGVNSVGTTNGSDATFMASTCTAPTATSGAASSITFTAATLNGTVSSNGAASTVTFNYGTTTGYGSSVTAAQSPLVESATGSSVSAAITGLACSTTYHFQVVGVNSVGTTNGSDATFTTSTCAAPTATTGTASSITFTTATLGGTVSSNGVSTTVSFNYGTTTGYGSSVTAAESPLSTTATGSSVSAAITGLACSTTYHFQVVGVNSVGTTNGGDATFTTSTCAVPTVTTNAASGVTFTAATLNGTVTSNGPSTTVTFQYGTSTSYGSTITATASPLGGAASGSAVSATATGLTCNTTYHFRVVGVNSVGTTNGGDLTFKTTACTTPTVTTGAASSISYTGAALAGTVSSNGASTTVTFQYGTSTGYGLSVTAAESPLATSATGSSVSATLTGLSCSTTYHYRVVGVNSVGTTNGSDASFTTSTCIAQNITFGTAPTLSVGMLGTLSATGGTSGNPVTFTSQTTGVCTVSGTNGATVTALTAGTCTIAANQLGNASYAAATQVTQSITVSLGTQTISALSFTPNTLTAGGTTTVSATASSGLIVTFTSTTTSVCTVGSSTLGSGTTTATVTASNVGSCSITATQAGNANYNAAGQVTGSITVGQGAQSIGTITFNPITLNPGGTTTVSASATSGLAVTFSSTTLSVCTVNGSIVTGVATGICTIAANQPGNTNYSAALQVTQGLSVGQSQTIGTIGFSPTSLYVGGGVSVSATASSGLQVSLAASPTSVCTIGSSTLQNNGTTVATLTGVAAGTCTITANQSGNVIYAAAPTVTNTITVGTDTLHAGAITFTPSTTLIMGQTATVSGGSTTYYSTTLPICTISGTTVTGVAPGTCTIVSNSGTATYTGSITVGQGSQTITFGTAPSVVVGGTGTVSATGGGSGNAVTFTSQTTNTCTVSGTTGSIVTGIAVGTCTLAADQAGNSSYLAATTATQNITVGMGTQVITFGSLPSIALGGTRTISATGGASGNAVIFSSATTSICTVSGTNGSTVNGVAVGNCSIVANQAGNNNYSSAQSTQSIQITGNTAQTIGSITVSTTPVLVGGYVTVSATASSGLTVTFSSLTPGYCTTGGNNGSVVTGVAPGVNACVIAADQSGNNTYAAATEVTQSITVSMIGSGSSSTISDDFTVANDMNPWLDMSYNGYPCLTAGSSAVATSSTNYNSSPTTSSIPGCNLTTPDAPSSGALRLTPASGSQHSAIVSNYTFPTNAGLQVTFTTYTWGGAGSGAGGANEGADGISFFLMDGTAPTSYTPPGGTLTPNLGSWGGSLAYTCSNANPPYTGLTGGYLGLGMDEYGNFLNGASSSTTYNDGTATGDPVQTTSASTNGYNSFASAPFFQANRIGLRGAGNVSWYWLNQNYPTLYPSTLSSSAQQTAVQAACRTGTLWNYSGISQPCGVNGASVATGGECGAWAANGASAPTSFNGGATLWDYPVIANGYAVLPSTQLISNLSATSRAQATPITYKLSITPAGLLNFLYSYNGGAYQSVLSNWNITTGNGPLPSSFRFGFAGSTGGAWNNHEITCFLAQPTQSNSSAGVNTVESGQVRTGTQVYLASYNPNNWAGALVSDPIVNTNGTLTVSTTSDWDGNCVLTGGSCASMGAGATVTAESPTSRQILTWNGSAGVPFEWANLTAGQQTILSNNAADAYGLNRLNWLRGDRSNEQNSSGVLRTRASVLGDIIDSNPTWIGPPTFSDTLLATRMNVVYVGGNDGILHGFRTGQNNTDGTYNSTYNDGYEVLGFVPATVLANTNVVGLTSPTYGHNYFVDASPGFGDLYYSGAWHTWLVSGLGSGGQEVFALDVTDPTGIEHANLAFTENNASSLVIGDWTPASLNTMGCINATTNCGNNLGNTAGTPLIRKIHDVNGTAGSSYAVIAGNGYGSTNGHAGIFMGVINESNCTGMNTNTGVCMRVYWLDTGVGSTTSPNGIGYVSSADLDGDGVTDYLYAGDLQGNVWRFDLTSSTPSDWGVSTYGQPGTANSIGVKIGPTGAPLFVTKDSSGTVQPITTKIAVTATITPDGAQRVILGLGTGRAIPFTSSASTTYATGTQSVYGLWDWDMAAWNANLSGNNTAVSVANAISYASLNELLTSPYLTFTRTNLQTDSINTTNSTSTARAVNNFVVCWQGTSDCSSATNNQYGWVFDLPSTQEQVVYNPIFTGGELIVNTTIPPSVATSGRCNQTLPTGWTMAFDMASGGAPAPVSGSTTQSAFANSSGSFTATTGTTIMGTKLNSVGTPYVVQVGSSRYIVNQTVSGVPVITQINPQGGVTVKLISWEQLR